MSTHFHIMRTWHPCYDAAGGVPAITEVKFSLISNRGCFGGCSFCALTFHQGRIVQTRSHESIIQGGRAYDPGTGFQGLHPRCRRSDRKLPSPGLRKADDLRCLSAQTVPVPAAVQES